ncbi:HAD superfamily hydrolase (TIGR01509 family) [Agrobacterium vitis]|nr:HAD superfamily hydrolase (TIGR01509 family) [Agrobacterium vitis]
MAYRVEIVDYDPAWPQHFAEASRNLSAILKGAVSLIDHVGSTAVPELAAKPKIDIDVTLTEGASISDACEKLERAGYEPRGARYGDGVFAFLLHGNPEAGNPGYRVYLCPPHCETHLKRMIFRDCLRRDPELAQIYAALKKQLAEHYRYDGDAYTKAKSAFIAKTIQMSESQISERTPSPMLPRPPKAVIFDMDGLILDSEILYRKSVISAGEHNGLLVGASVYEGMLGQPWPNIARLLRDHYGDDFDADAFRVTWLEHFDQLMALELNLKAGVLALLDVLDQYDIPRAICTSSNHSQVQHHLADFGILPRFHHIIAQGDYAHGKPAPDPYLTAAAKLGVDPKDCLALEDSHNGIRSAASAGMMAVMVPDLLPPSDEIRAMATLIIDDLHQCCRFFEGQFLLQRG